MFAFPLRVYDLAEAAEILGFFATSPIMPARSLQNLLLLKLSRSLPQHELPPATTPGDHFRHREYEAAPTATMFTQWESCGDNLAVETTINAKQTDLPKLYCDLTPAEWRRRFLFLVPKFRRPLQVFVALVQDRLRRPSS